MAFTSGDQATPATCALEAECQLEGGTGTIDPTHAALGVVAVVGLVAMVRWMSR